MKKNILERMKESPVVFDGAMGTMIYDRGVFINTCYDELCLTNPDLIAEIHRAYVLAGADVIETNTFGANAIKLAQYGLADRVEEINREGARLARQVAGDDVYVAGSVGPCLRARQLLKEETTDRVQAAFRQQINVLAQAGVDFILLETFSNLDELRLATRIARETGLPVFASVTVDEEGKNAIGTPVEDLVSSLENDPDVDSIGINCGTGPASAYEAVDRALKLTTKPLFVMPNAGFPREQDGRMIYLASPEYITEYAKRFIARGVNAVGSCCGTTPEHTREIARAIKSLSGVKKHIQIQTFERPEAQVEVIPVEHRSRFANKIARGEEVTSVEILPPRSCDLTDMLEKARQCHLHGVDAMNIPDGPRASSRVSPMIAAIAIKNAIGIEPILHYACRDRNLIGMQSDIMGGFAAGLANFLIVTGDPPKLGEYPDATGVFDVDAIGLTKVVRNLNHGYDVGGNPIKKPTAIYIGVGANPCAVDLAREIDRFILKVEAGAEFAITQPVFDPAALFRFLDKVEKRGALIPIVAGVWPLISFKNAEFMQNEVPGVEIPDSVMSRMAACQTRDEARAEGIDIARNIIDAVRTRVAGFQVSAPFNNVEIALEVLKRHEFTPQPEP